MTYCKQETDMEALWTLRGGLNMNNLFWRDVKNQNLTTYDALVKILKSEIVTEELIDHRNRTSLGLPPLQRQRRGPLSHLVTFPWIQAGQTIVPTSAQALATATLNAIPSLAYEEVFPKHKLEGTNS